MANKNRIGIGYDIHKYRAGRNLILGGVHIPFRLGLDGHSDADCLTHSIIDAFLGATSNGDIGDMFGIDEPETEGISSLYLLERVWKELKTEYSIVNLDTVIIAEKPRLSEYIMEMESNLAKVLKIKEDQLSIKTTTAKKL